MGTAGLCIGFLFPGSSALSNKVEGRKVYWKVEETGKGMPHVGKNLIRLS